MEVRRRGIQFTTDQEKIELVQATHNAGIDTFDTAPVYGKGKVESLLSYALQGQKAKFITKIPALTKPRQNQVLNTSEHYPKDHLVKSIEQSLFRLGSIETILLHNWHSNFDVDLLHQLRECATTYGIKNIGISLPNYALKVSDEVFSAVDFVMINYIYAQKTLALNPAPSEQKLLYRSLFNKGSQFKGKSANLVVGMTSLNQVYQNILGFEAKHHSFSPPSQETVIGKTTSKAYQMLTLTYGSLATTKTDPLVCVSHAHTSLSIDLWVGCAFKCAYCHVQGTKQDLINGKMPTTLFKRSKYSIKQILDRLEASPFYNNEIPLSIGTSSTEPLAKGKVVESTLQIMEEVIKKGWKNPFWIVTKNGYTLTQDQHERMQKILTTNKVLISFCYASNPKEIEPAQFDRFRGIYKFKEIGGITAWYMRPICVEWGGNLANLANIIAEVASKYSDAFDMIVPGGLRWTEGIEYGMIEVHKQPMPELTKEHNKKSLDTKTWFELVRLLQRAFPNIPIYKKSSCMLSFAFEKPSYTLLNLLEEQTCQKCSVCPSKQRKLCSSKEITPEDIEQAYNSYGLTSPGTCTVDTLLFDQQDYLVNQAIIHKLGG